MQDISLQRHCLHTSLYVFDVDDGDIHGDDRGAEEAVLASNLAEGVGMYPL